MIVEVEEDEEEVEGDGVKDSVGFGDIGLFFEVDENGVFGEL